MPLEQQAKEGTAVLAGIVGPHHQVETSLQFQNGGGLPGVGTRLLLEISHPGGKWKDTQLSSVAQSCPTLRPHEPQHARPPCPSPTPGVHSSPCPSSWGCHPTISSSVVLFSSCLQSFPASGSFQMSQLFASGGQSIGVSASTSVLPRNIQD